MSGLDAIVVGGGLNGLAASVVVGRAGLKVVHVAPKAPPDRRTSALMGPSVDFLREAGLVASPETLGVPLTRIRIIDATRRLIRAPETLFEAEESGLPAFGWNFPNIKLAEAFEAARESLGNLEIREAAVVSAEQATTGGWRVGLADGSTLDAPLLVGADGKKSLIRAAARIPTREHGFTQSALVADLELSRGLEGTSVEFHYPQGPFTLVPAGDNRANLVWIDDEAVLKGAREGGEEALKQRLMEKSQRLFGDIRLVSPAFVFPLSTLSVAIAGQNGVALVGEAAHAFPPIGAQGLNLGLRDVADLANALTEADRSMPAWAVTASDSYADRRKDDLLRTGTMVDGLFRSLLSDFLPAQALRAAGLWTLKLMPPLRRQAIEMGMGAR